MHHFFPENVCPWACAICGHSQSKNPAQGRVLYPVLGLGFKPAYIDTKVAYQRLPPSRSPAATAAVATAATATTIATATAVAPWRLQCGFIYFDLTAVETETIEFLDSLLCLAVARHLDEGKALALTRITIRDHVDRIDRSALAKHILQGLLVS
jgi:hypothetical protein